MNSTSSYVLWLPSWYPTMLSPFDGDFIQRHARAAAQFIPVHVLYIAKDSEGLITRETKIEENTLGNLRETIIYYYSPRKKIKLLDGFLSRKKFNRIYKDYLANQFRMNRRSTAVHVHVIYRAGLIALWLRKRFQLDYYVTEHWTGYDKSSYDNFFTRSQLFRRTTLKILRLSKCVIPVSFDLGKKLQNLVPTVKLKIIPNTVDINQFYPGGTPKAFRFVHNVSSFKGQKNTEGLLRVLNRLKEVRIDWDCLMYGPMNDELKEMVNKFNLESKVVFTGQISYQRVAEELRSSSAFISFSNFENQPCSILEALCCGIPVIATCVGGIAEIINEQNGILIDPGDESQLLEAIQKMMDEYIRFDKTAIAGEARRLFSYEAVGKQFYTLYK
jgi:glycosyltransferase involved in cell wall biosynthesis